MVNPGQLITAMVTPFDDNGSLSKERTEKLVSHLVENGTNCILVSGTTGETPTLSDNEKLDLLGWVKEFVPDGFPVMFGAGTNSTAKSIELSKKAKDKGADILLLVVPYYNKPPQEGMFQHFTQIADAVKLPAILYNIPSRTGVNMSVKTVARLAENEHIIGIKEASGSLDAASEIRLSTGSDFLIYSGDDSLTLPLLSVGGDGVISVASHLAGIQISEMIDVFKKGKIEDARKIHIRLFPLIKGLFMMSNPIPVKEALNLIGVKVGGVRLPLIECDDESRKVLSELLRQFDLM
ncbi:4-hydroxy-tetrahydrodipicolinate synthase [bacterium]|nr:4-hydroxy-tetrahydrodipicolinate synthase [bacterium]